MKIKSQIEICKIRYSMSNKDIAKALGVSDRRVSNIINAKDWKLSTVERIAGVFGLGICEFLMIK